MKHFFNARDTLVTEALNGTILAAGSGRLARLDGYPHIKVLLRREVNRGQVAVISGGGSGHEPAHAGFVGPGMLTAAVAGEIFASPSVEAVLAAILAVTGGLGCLLIVKNYTGDRLNFGLAAERAKQLGLQVEVVIVADDIALPDAPQPRGLAGTLFVHKIAGYLAEAGRPLAEVAAAARSAAAAIYSFGAALAPCTIPGQRPEHCIEYRPPVDLYAPAFLRKHLLLLRLQQDRDAKEGKGAGLPQSSRTGNSHAVRVDWSHAACDADALGRWHPDFFKWCRID